MGLGYFLQPEQYYRPLPLHITTVGRFSNVGHMILLGNTRGFSGSAWPANNRAIYVPISMPRRFTVARFFTANAANGATGNVDLGLYSWTGTRLLSLGSTSRAGGGSLAVAYFSVTARSFPPGRYYLACVLSSTAANIFNAVMDDLVNAESTGILQEALGSTVLPSTMTPAAVAAANGWCFGFSQSATY